MKPCVHLTRDHHTLAKSRASLLNLLEQSSAFGRPDPNPDPNPDPDPDPDPSDVHGWGRSPGACQTPGRH